MKKSTLHTRSVTGFVLLFLLLLTLFAGRASAAKMEELLAIVNNTRPNEVRQLIQDGSDVNTRNNDGWMPLMAAAAFSTNPEVLKVLIEAGAEVNAKDTSGGTPLMAAAEKNSNLEVLTVLL